MAQQKKDRKQRSVPAVPTETVDLVHNPPNFRVVRAEATPVSNGDTDTEVDF
jgi:hypothetical protein